jgi:glycosyltransferase involved in cell wall biosynthesis
MKNPEIVEVGTCGVLGGPGDWKGLAEGVMEMLADPAGMHGMGQAARKRAVERFGLRDDVRQMANLFRHLLGYAIPGKNILQRDKPPIGGSE